MLSQPKSFPLNLSPSLHDPVTVAFCTPVNPVSHGVHQLLSCGELCLGLNKHSFTFL
jgi:hypothetical protein